MNVIITLPKHLIAAIIKGEKFFEIRSNRPLYFNKQQDVVFVVQKGSRMVPLYFTITAFRYYDTSSDKGYLAEKAAVSEDYIDNYMKRKNNICAWEIGCACKVSCPIELYTDLKISKNPESFIYRYFEWRQVGFWSYKWLSKPQNPSVILRPNVEYLIYMRSLLSAKPSTL